LVLFHCSSCNREDVAQIEQVHWSLCLVLCHCSSCIRGDMWVLKHIPGAIVIKPGPGVDPAKGPGPGFHGSTRVNPD